MGRSDLDLGKKVGVWKFLGGILGNVRFGLGKKLFGNLGGGVFLGRSDLGLGKKLEFGNFFGGVGCFLSEVW